MEHQNGDIAQVIRKLYGNHPEAKADAEKRLKKRGLNPGFEDAMLAIRGWHPNGMSYSSLDSCPGRDYLEVLLSHLPPAEVTGNFGKQAFIW
jgi:hypothetical protein